MILYIYRQMILPGDGFQSCPSSWCSSRHWRASYPTRGRRGPCCALQSDDKFQKLNAERNAPGEKRVARTDAHRLAQEADEVGPDLRRLVLVRAVPHLRKRVVFFECSRCMSRACLGKLTGFRFQKKVDQNNPVFACGRPKPPGVRMCVRGTGCRRCMSRPCGRSSRRSRGSARRFRRRGPA